MIKKRRKIAAVILAALLALSLIGCGGSSKFSPTQTSIYIRKDRTVASAEVEEFDNSSFDVQRYDEEELLAFVEEIVINYNETESGLAYAYAKETKEDLPVSITSLSVSNGMATLILNYASADDYLAFCAEQSETTIEDLIVGTVEDGNNSGLDYSGMVKADGTEVEVSKIASSTSMTLVMIIGSATVQVQGTVRYMSAEVTLVEDDTVVTPEGTSYIIFK